MRNLFLTSLLLVSALSFGADSEPIDRRALVTRHNPSVSAVDTLSPFSLGNGAFAFTADITGLQSFYSEYADTGIPLSTQSEWGWHSFPNTEGYRIEDTYVDFDTYGRPVPYPFAQQTPAGQFLRGNPHRIGLGRIAFVFTKTDGSTATLDEIQAIDQQLDMWTGVLRSRFAVDGETVEVETVCHPDEDLVAVSVSSTLASQDRLAIELSFAYGTSAWGIAPEDWTAPDKHQSEPQPIDENRIHIARTLDSTRYGVDVAKPANATFSSVAPHRFRISSGDSKSFALSVRFSPDATPAKTIPSFAETKTASSASWQRYWTSGGAVDLSQSSDPRAVELERRIVLSQYLTAIQCRGELPPQETGLTFNSWYGKPHLEMHWWHLVHFALWNRIEVVEDQLAWYSKIRDKARRIAEVQGYDGVRWPKNVDPAGNQAPSTISPLLVWQQPHPIYFAELVYRQKPTDETLQAYDTLVSETADFMASFVHLDPESGYYQLGPPLIPAQESYDPKVTRNPPFELAYWRWALETSQRWQERQGLPRDAHRDDVLARLAPYPLFEDRYATAQGVWNAKDHPSVLAAFGMIHGDGVDADRMRRTLRHVLDTYDWQHTWGWDYPMIAMTAARLGEPELAIKALLLDVPKNVYLNNGHNHQEQNRLRLYLPGNGGLLAAIAMMAAGWTDTPDHPAPGFPQDGSWIIKSENLHPMP